MACATPIAGYENEAFGGVVRASGTGFATGLNNPGQLAERIAELHLNRQRLAEAARAALRFAAEHTFEKTMQARVEHLLMCMGSRQGAGLRAAGAGAV
jgi:glycosyltransferase involved in cell wall biosynthesis